MDWRYSIAISSLLFTAAACPACLDEAAKSPAFTTVAELSSGFHSLYALNFSEAREKFDNWEAQHPEEPFARSPSRQVISSRNFTVRVCSPAIFS
jgi:hypothetical protein